MTCTKTKWPIFSQKSPHLNSFSMSNSYIYIAFVSSKKTYTWKPASSSPAFTLHPLISLQAKLSIFSYLGASKINFKQIKNNDASLDSWENCSPSKQGKKILTADERNDCCDFTSTWKETYPCKKVSCFGSVHDYQQVRFQNLLSKSVGVLQGLFSVCWNYHGFIESDLILICLITRIKSDSLPQSKLPSYEQKVTRVHWN